MSLSQPIRLLIVDDHPAVRDVLRGVLDQETGLELATGVQALPDAVGGAWPQQ